MLSRAPLACLFVLCAAAGVRAQTLPAEPIVLGDGELTLGGAVSGTVGPDDPGFFNYTNYEYSMLRMLRMDLTASLRAGDHVALLGELRSQNIGAPEAYALYLRVRPWTHRQFDLQLGRVPPTFGAFPRRSYEADNPLIGYPLAYQYLTSIRPDAVPGSVGELLQMRARGWLATYSVGNLAPATGVPLANAFRWDTGVQAHAASDIVDVTGSVTAGTISNPLFKDDNGGRQLAARVAVHPVPGLVLGASAAHGAFLATRAVQAALGEAASTAGGFDQTAVGGDAEFSRGYYVLRAETVFSQWTLPAVGSPALHAPLRALGTFVEGRYKIRPGLYAAARIDHLGFSDVAGPQGPISWDAPITRFEVGGGYSIQRNLLAKITVQHDSRAAGRFTTATFLSGQLVYWF
jgi:hypothetical protein